MLVLAGTYMLGPYMLYPILYIYGSHCKSFQDFIINQDFMQNLILTLLFKKKIPTMQRLPNPFELLENHLQSWISASEIRYTSGGW